MFPRRATRRLDSIDAVILVHPWYARTAEYSPAYRIVDTSSIARMSRVIEPSSAYDQNIAELVKATSHKMILLEEQRVIPQTNELLNSIAGKLPVDTVATMAHDPTPTQGWDALFRLLPLGATVGLAGGKLVRDPCDLQYGGCLGGVYENLRRSFRQPVFIEGCCYDAFFNK